MAYLTLQTQTIGDWQFGGSTAYLYIWASQPFYEATTGEYIARGQVNNLTSFYQKITCTVSGTTLTIPEVVLATTTDSTVPNATYTATLATSANRFVYPLLQNFFVDPEYLESSVQASVEMASAGTAAINGLYTYRGQTGGYNYYNLQGQSTSTTLFVVKNDGSQWKVTDSIGTTMYTTATQEDLPWDGGWIIASGAANAPNVSENADYISGTWEQLTLSNQGVSAIPPQWPGPFWNVPQIKEYVNGLVGTGTTPFASKTVIGKTALDENPVLSSDPVAVAINSNRILRVLVEDYANNLATAVTDIGSTPTTLVIKEDATVSTAVTIPATLYLEFQQGAVLTKSLSGALEFEGFGITDPTSQVPIFANFTVGGIQWTGTDYPAVLSTELFDTGNVSLTDRYKLADAALAELPAQIVAYPRTVTNSATVTEGHSLYFTDGDYPNTIATYGTTYLPPFLLQDNTSVSGSNGARLYESPTANNSYYFSAYHMRYNGGETTEAQNDIYINNLYFVGDAAQVTSTGASTILLGNCTRGWVRDCTFYRMHAYAVVVGGGGGAGNYADDVDVTRNNFLGMGTQNVAPINAKNCRVQYNYFDCRDTVGTSSYTVIDVEGNDTGDVQEDIDISYNYLDLRDAAAPAKYSSGITINPAAGVGAKNISIRGNTIIGGDLNTATTPAALVGLGISGVEGLTVTDNYFQSIGQLGFYINLSRYGTVTNNSGLRNQDSAGDDVCLRFAASASMAVFGNIFQEDASAVRQSTAIGEAEIAIPASASGSVITSLQPNGANRFYQHMAGLALFYNGTTYTISSVNTTAQTATMSTSVGTVVVKTFTSADVTTGSGNIAIVTHGYNTGARVTPTTAGTLPVNAGLVAGTDVYVIAVDANNIKLATTLANALANAPMTYSGAGSGISTLTPALTTRFSANTYAENFADDGIFVESTGTSRILSDYRREIKDSLAISISANTNNLAPSRSAYRLDITTDASRDLTGLVFSAPPNLNGERHEIYNAGAQNLVIIHNATSTAANRFWTNTLADLTVLPGQRVLLEYNSTISRWMVAAYGVIITAASLPTAIDAAKIADGLVSNTEFQYLNGVSSAIQTQMDLKAPLISPSFTTPAIGVATGTSLAATGLIKSSSATAGIGYATGAGGAVTQATDKSTTVVSNTITTAITMNNAALNLDTAVSFTFTNSSIAATDTVLVTHQSAGTSGAYVCNAFPGSGSAVITVRNVTGGSLSEAIVLRVTVIKSVSA